MDSSAEAKVVMRKPLPLQQPPEEDFSDTLESTSVDDIPINEYSDDNIDDIVEANAMIESHRTHLYTRRKSSGGGKASCRITPGHPNSPEDAVDEYADGVSEEEAQAILAATGTLKKKDRGERKKLAPGEKKKTNTEQATKPENQTRVRANTDHALKPKNQTLVKTENKTEKTTEDEKTKTEIGTEHEDATVEKVMPADGGDPVGEEQTKDGAENVQENAARAGGGGEEKKMDEGGLADASAVKDVGRKKAKAGNVLGSLSKTLKQRLGQVPKPFSKLTGIPNTRSSRPSLLHEPSPPSHPPLPPPPLPPPPPAIADAEPQQHSSDSYENKEERDDDDLETHAAMVTDEKAATKQNGGRLESTRINMTKLIGAGKSGEGRKDRLLSVSVTSKKPDSAHRSALTKLLCGLYALLLVVIALVLAVASSLTPSQRHIYLQVFLLYLYLGSLVVLLYLQLCVLRGRQANNKNPDNSLRIIVRRNPQNPHVAPLAHPRGNYSTILEVATPTPVAENPTEKGGFEPRKESLVFRPSLSNVVNLRYSTSSFRSSGCDFPRLSTSDFRSNASDFRSNASDFRSQLVLPPDGGVAHVGEGINFFLRLGALGFSVGSVTMNGLHLASDLENEVAGVKANTCHSPLFLPVNLLHLLFTFLQTFFLFKNHRVVVNRQKAAVRFCLVHLLATNLCVWAVTVVSGTTHHYYRQQDSSVSDPSRFVRNTTPSHLKSGCYRDLTLASAASPYLFPCTVIYSIIAAGIVYRIYANVGVHIKRRWPSHASFTSSAAPHGIVLVDCEKAHKGLFSGLLVAVGTVIAIATFFVLDTRLNKPESAVKVFFVLEISLLLLSGGGVLTGLRHFQKLRFLKTPPPSTPLPTLGHSSASTTLDSLLLLLTLGGVYLYLGFRLLSSAFSLAELPPMSPLSVLSVLSLLLELCQVTLQVVFVMDGLCRRAYDESQGEQKPGRAAVTFVLVCNLAQWLLTLFETRRAQVVPLHAAFYGPLPWTFFLHLCVPLYIYFRFHSAICLSKIWYHTYTMGD